jgi:hypothetical protein
VRTVEDGVLTLANPAEGYAGIFETLTERQFYNVGPCSAVWLAPEEDMAEIARLNGVVADQTNLLPATGRVVTAMQHAQFRRDRPVNQYPGQTVGQFLPAIRPYLAIALGAGSPCPDSAPRCRYDARPEPRSDGTVVQRAARAIVVVAAARAKVLAARAGHERLLATATDRGDDVTLRMHGDSPYRCATAGVVDATPGQSCAKYDSRFWRSYARNGG